MNGGLNPHFWLQRTLLEQPIAYSPRSVKKLVFCKTWKEIFTSSCRTVSILLRHRHAVTALRNINVIDTTLYNWSLRSFSSPTTTLVLCNQHYFASLCAQRINRRRAVLTLRLRPSQMCDKIKQNNWRRPVYCSSHRAERGATKLQGSCILSQGLASTAIKHSKLFLQLFQLVLF